MSAHFSRKRARATEEDEDVPPLKRELDPDRSVDPSDTLPAQPDADSEGQAREGRVFKQDEEFWFEDGTVILLARDTEFRVYEGLLARVSPVFRGLFSESHKLRTVHMREKQTLSCSVVDVSDAPEDLRYLLRACFSRRLGSLYRERQPSYHEISAAIRLGDKYKVAELYSQSMDYLKHYFPSTLNSWTTLTSYVPPGWKDLEAISVVNLARLTGELSILPSAFIACICGSSLGAKEGAGIGHEIPREDGSREFLSPLDLSLCFEGKTYLRLATVGAVFDTFAPTVSQGCKTPSDCKRTLHTVLLDLERNLDMLLEGDPFATYEEFALGPVDVCPDCVAMVQDKSLKERKRVWNRLPELLVIDVPGWGEQPPQKDAN